MNEQNLQNRNEVKEVKFHHKVKRFYHKNLFRKIYTVAIIGLVAANIVSMVKYSSLADDLYVKGGVNECDVMEAITESWISFGYGSHIDVYECGHGMCELKDLFCDDGDIYEDDEWIGTDCISDTYYRSKCSVTVDENSPREYGFGYSSSDFYLCSDGECESKSLKCAEDGNMEDSNGNTYDFFYTSYCSINSAEIGNNYEGNFFLCSNGGCTPISLTCNNGNMRDDNEGQYNDNDVYFNKCSVIVDENSTREYGFGYSSSNFYGCSDGECESKNLSCVKDGNMKDGEGNSYSKIYTSYCGISAGEFGDGYNGDFYECEDGVCTPKNLTCDSQNGGMKDGEENSYSENLYLGRCRVNVDGSSKEYGYGYSSSDFYLCSDGECESKNLSCVKDGNMKDGEGNSYDKIYAGRCSINIDENSPREYGYGSKITILPNVSSSPVMVECDTDGIFRDENGTSYNYCYKEMFTITFAVSLEGYGSVDQTTVTVDEGTAVVVNNDTVTLGTEIVTATPTADTAQYDYEFVNWTNDCGDTVSNNCTIVANFSRTDITPTPSHGSSGGRPSGNSHNSANDKNKSEENKDTEDSKTPVEETTDDASENVSSDQNDASDNKSKGENVANLNVEKNDTRYTSEQHSAYQFAKENGITTTSSIREAKMNTPITRIQMAKMLSYYAINILNQTPDASRGVVKFKDVSTKLDAQYDNGVTLAYQLGIMGINMPNREFRPNDTVTRAEFATALSRMLFNVEDGTGKVKYYEPHIARLYNEGIITNTNPKLVELRGYVMTMLMRTVK